MSAPREQVMNALLQLLKQAYQFTTVSRSFRMWNEVDDAEMPALFLVEGKEKLDRPGEGLPGVHEWPIMAIVYSWTKDVEFPAAELNDILDGLETTLEPVGGMQRQTLSGLVYNCWIEGEIHKDPGYLDGIGIAAVPIVITAY